MNENRPKSKDVFVSRKGGTDQSPEEIMERKKRRWKEMFDEILDEEVRKRRVLQKEKQRKEKQKALDKKPN